MIFCRYVNTWNDGSDGQMIDYANNPLNSYHFLRRLTLDFQDVENALKQTHSQGQSLI